MHRYSCIFHCGPVSTAIFSSSAATVFSIRLLPLSLAYQVLHTAIFSYSTATAIIRSSTATAIYSSSTATAIFSYQPPLPLSAKLPLSSSAHHFPLSAAVQLLIRYYMLPFSATQLPLPLSAHQLPQSSLAPAVQLFDGFMLFLKQILDKEKKLAAITIFTLSAATAIINSLIATTIFSLTTAAIIS